MNFEKDSQTVIDGNNLYVIDTLDYEENYYLYTQLVDSDDDLTDQYFVYKIQEKPVLVDDQNELKIVLEKFADKLNKELEMGE